MLSTPTPNLPTTAHLEAERRTLSVTRAKQVMMPSTPFAMDARVSSLTSGATSISMPASASTALSGSTEGQT